VSLRCAVWPGAAGRGYLWGCGVAGNPGVSGQREWASAMAHAVGANGTRRLLLPQAPL